MVGLNAAALTLDCLSRRALALGLGDRQVTHEVIAQGAPELLRTLIDARESVRAREKDGDPR